MLRFKPFYQPKPWGGRRLEEQLGRKDLPDGGVGESWELSELPVFESQVVDGEQAGKGLGELWRSGALGGSAEGGFPFLLKWLDTTDQMSVQVHPDEEFCKNTRLGNPKTEAWYIFHAEHKSKLLVGNYPGLDPTTLLQAVERGSLKKWMYEATPRPGDIYLVEAGTMHSVGGGFLILEVQQPSDTTFRIHDWGRQGSDGQERELHLDEASASIRYNRFDLPQPSRDKILGPCFDLAVYKMGTALPRDGLRVVVAEKTPTRLIADSGEYELHAGDCVVLEPSDGAVTLALGSCVFITEPATSD